MPAVQLEPLVRRIRHAVGRNTTSALTDGEILARFTLQGDEDAFAVLVRRHGPLVLGVCRRMLRDWHAADDAFQAVFLLLARKADSLARPDLLANWLYGVACRTAARARAEAARRRARESKAPVARATAPEDDLTWRDLRPVLDEEVSRLPERYRVPVVLCYLQGQTNAEAARRLGCSRGTVATLLARARQRLRRQLTRRGVTLAGGLAASWLVQQVHAANVPALLESSTVNAAIRFAAEEVQAAGLISAQAASLAKGVAQAMLLHKVKVAVAILLAGVALASFGVGLGAGRVGPEAVAQAEEVPSSKRPEPESAPPAAPAVPLAALPVAPALYRTKNFECAAPTLEIARQIARAAERHRKALALLWLGKEMPPWPKPCTVRVRISNSGAGGATAFAFDGGKVMSQNMHLEGTLEQIKADLLPHEISHTVLAHWSGGPVPRWADEGASLLAESAASRARHAGLLLRMVDEGRLLPLRLLLPLREFPKDVMVLYVQGHSLTDYLVQRTSRAKFLAFVAQGERDGWDKAVKAHFGHDKVEELQRAWLASVDKNLRKAAPGQTTKIKELPTGGVAGWSLPRTARREPKGKLPASPPPEQVLVALESDGRLTVWGKTMSYRPVTVYEPVRDQPQGRRASTYYVPIHVLVERSYKVSDVKVHDTTGKAIDSAELPRLLKGEVPALVAADGNPIDPLHLRLVKEGTLIFLLPRPAVEPTQPPPPAVVPEAPVVVPIAPPGRPEERGPSERPGPTRFPDRPDDPNRN
jgi:RNA polymerase sigma factor (sigma-70 family)